MPVPDEDCFEIILNRSIVEKSMYADAPVNRNTECFNLEKGSASGKRTPLELG